MTRETDRPHSQQPDGRQPEREPDLRLAALWSAQSIAVVGATERDGAMGRLPVQYLKERGFTGEILPVNPKGGTILGIPAFATIEEATVHHGSAIDLALVMVPAAAVPTTVGDCAAAGVRVCVVMSSGFGEVGADGLKAQQALVQVARNAGMRLVGPNCIGSVGGSRGVFANFSPVFSAPSTPKPAGPLALVSQSGALGFGALSLGLEREVPIGITVTTGNEADVSAADVAEALSHDEDVEAILMYLESVENLEALSRAAHRLPVFALKAGRSEAGAVAAASHTGVLTAEDHVVNAALKRAGVARVDTIEHLLDAGMLASTGATLREPADPLVGLGVITTSGGSGILAADAVEVEGMSMATLSGATRTQLAAVVPAYGNANNPVDVTAAVMAEPGLFERCVHVLAQDPAVDAVVACFAVLVGDDVVRIASALGEVRRTTGKPVVAARTGAAALAPDGARLLAEGGVPVYPTPERAVAALRALRDATRGRQAPQPPANVGPRAVTPRPGASEREIKEALQAAGLPVPLSSVVTDIGEASSAVAAVGGRAVFKALVPGLLHKSDAGGVVVDVDEAGAEQAFSQCSALGGDVLVERFVPRGVEVLVGFTPSPMGRVLTVGVGGVLTEVVSDVAVDLLPVDGAAVNAMLDRTRLGALLAGTRGQPPADRESLVEVILQLCAAVDEWPADSAIEFNPISVGILGCWILDAMLTSGDHGSSEKGKPAWT